MKLKYSAESLYAKGNSLMPCVWMWDATLGGATKAVCARIYRDGRTNGTELQLPITTTRLRPAEVVAPIVGERSLQPGRRKGRKRKLRA